MSDPKPISPEALNAAALRDELLRTPTHLMAGLIQQALDKARAEGAAVDLEVMRKATEREQRLIAGARAEGAKQREDAWQLALSEHLIQVEMGGEVGETLPHILIDNLRHAVEERVRAEERQRMARLAQKLKGFPAEKLIAAIGSDDE